MKQYLKRNKALFFLPLGMLPFVVLIFYVLGGGDGAKENTSRQAEMANMGANYELPEAEKSIEIYDKMEAYQNDGALREKQRQVTREDTLQFFSPALADSSKPQLSLRTKPKTSEELLAHIYRKQEQTKQELNGEQKQNTLVVKTDRNKKSGPVRPVLKRQLKQEPTKTINTGIEELDRIVDQNISLSRENDSLNVYLEQVRARLQALDEKLNNAAKLEKKHQSAFNREEEPEHSLFKAEIYETATVLDGNRVKLRLLEDAFINGKRIFENTFLYGVCKIKNERLHIEITQVPLENDFVPVKLRICDLDGMEGLYVPDNAARKVYREVGASANTSSMMGVSNNPLAYAGIQATDRATQTLLKSVRLKKIRVKRNTLVYIINQK